MSSDALNMDVGGTQASALMKCRLALRIALDSLAVNMMNNCMRCNLFSDIFFKAALSMLGYTFLLNWLLSRIPNCYLFLIYCLI